MEYTVIKRDANTSEEDDEEDYKGENRGIISTVLYFISNAVSGEFCLINGPCTLNYC